MEKIRNNMVYEERGRTMTSAELKAYLERVIAELPPGEERISADILLFFRWWDKAHGARLPVV